MKDVLSRRDFLKLAATGALSLYLPRRGAEAPQDEKQETIIGIERIIFTQRGTDGPNLAIIIKGGLAEVLQFNKKDGLFTDEGKLVGSAHDISAVTVDVFNSVAQDGSPVFELPLDGVSTPSVVEIGNTEIPILLTAELLVDVSPDSEEYQAELEKAQALIIERTGGSPSLAKLRIRTNLVTITKDDVPGEGVRRVLTTLVDVVSPVDNTDVLKRFRAFEISSDNNTSFGNATITPQGPRDVNTRVVPVNVSMSFEDQVSEVIAESTPFPEQPEAVFPAEIDQSYFDEIVRMGYKWKIDENGNVLVNFGNYNSYFEDKTSEDQFVLAFTKTEGGYKTNAFIHNADMISTTDTEGFADSLKERGRGGENVFKTQSDGTFGFIAMSTGAIIEKTVQTKENGEAKVIEAVFVCVDKDDALTYQSAITSVCYTDGAYKVLVGYGMNPKTPQTPQEASEYLTQGKVLELFIDHKGNKNFDPRSSSYRYITDFTLGFVPVAKEMLSTKEFPVSNTSIPTFTMGNI